MIYGQPITFGGGGSVPDIFGDGSDGVGLFTSNTTWNAPTADTGMIVKNFTELTIANGITVSAGNRNCGMIIRVQGDCNIAGTIKNVLSPKTLLASDGVDFSIYPPMMMNAVAGKGGDGGSNPLSSVSGGAGMSGRVYGGGWSGGGASGAVQTGTSDSALTTVKVAATAGGAANGITTAIADSALFDGGDAQVKAGTGEAKGVAGKYGGGGGGGFKASSYSTSANITSGGGGSGAGKSGTAGDKRGPTTTGGGGAGNYGGGVVILLVGGKLTINGTINCAGSKGGGAGTTHGGNSNRWTYGGASGGGGGGGGRIFVCHKGELIGSPTYSVNGGAGGSGAGYTAYSYDDDGNTVSYPLTTKGTPAPKAGNSGGAGGVGTIDVYTYDEYVAAVK